MEKPFVSYAQNSEDVVLWRALHTVGKGRYVDVGANDPVDDSVTKVFADAGWDGLCVEPLPELAAKIRDARPDAHVFEGVAAAAPGELVLHAVPGTGLSSLVDSIGDEHVASGRAVTDLTVAARTLDSLLEECGWDGLDIHLVNIDTEGAEADVLQGFDLRRWRPQVLVVEAVAPNSTTPVHDAWEQGVLDSGYVFCLFDGLSRFYVAEERMRELGAALSYPACILDGFVTMRHEAEAQLLRASVDHLTRTVDHLTNVNDSLLGQVIHWRNAALGTWAEAVVSISSLEMTRTRMRRARSEARRLRERVTEMEASRSWRLTKGLRLAGSATRRRGSSER